MANFLKDIEKLCKELGEKPEQIVIGELGYPDKPMPKEYFNTPLNWDDVSYLFNYTYDDDFGCAECHPVYIYTKSYVILVSEYDGATSLVNIPRYPQECEPKHI